MSKEKLSDKIWEQSVDWVDGIREVIGKLATQLGVASEHVYEVYTRQVFYEGLFGVVVGGLITIALIILGVVFLRMIFKDAKGNNDFNELHMLGFFVSICIFFGGSTYTLLEYVQPSFFKLMNPEYYTMKEILNTLKGIVKQ